MSSDYKAPLTDGQKDILSGIPWVPQATFAAMASRQNETTVEYVKRCIEANDKAQFAASSLLGELIVEQTGKVLTGQSFGQNLIPWASTAWIADNIHEAICKFVEAVECEAKTMKRLVLESKKPVDNSALR